MPIDTQEYAEFLAFKKIKQQYSGSTMKSVGDTPHGQQMHGPGGLFSQLGIGDNVFSTMIMAKGLGYYLPKRATRSTNPQYPILLGQEDSFGTESQAVCDNPPTAGLKKSGLLTAQFGILRRQSSEIDTVDMARQINVAENMGLRLIGDVISDQTGFYMDPGAIGNNDILNNSFISGMHSVMVDMSRVLSQQLWSGSPVGATPGNREFPGLENQIATGQVDAVTGTAMPAADSLVLDFGGDDVCGGGRDIVQYMTQADQSLRHIASRTGVDATWAICMHPDLWFDFTECWPCIYLTNRCSNIGAQNAEARLVVEAEANRLLRDEMRRSMTIDINGNIYPVITDDGISNSGTTGLTERSSSIFFVPLTVNRIEATRLEYLDMRVATMLPTSVNRRQDFWTNEGFYIWVLDQNMTCIKVVGRTEARVVLRTPWLAARIDDITYDPLRLLRPPYPGASGFVDGGASSVSFPQSVPGQDAVWAS